MVRRTFGWAQDASNLDSLRRILQVLVPGTEENEDKKKLIKKYVVDPEIREKMITALANGGEYPYILLKGTSGEQMTVEQNITVFGLSEEDARKKTLKGGRANATCTGIIQIALPAQTKLYYKPYQNDWSAESYLKLAISLGFLSWDSQNDTCLITGRGFVAATAVGKELNEIYIDAMLSYPPAVRVLQILSEDMKPHTKFEIGGQLGFIGEAGFDSLDIGYFLWCLNSANPSFRGEIKSNKEKMCDKYARMTCSMLSFLGLVSSIRVDVSASFAGINYGPEKMQAYQITPAGYDALKNSYGNSSHRQIPRLVMYETLATAAPDYEFLRFRRANIIISILKKSLTLDEIRNILSSVNIDTSVSVIENDIKGLRNIGLRIENTNGKYILRDSVVGLIITKENVYKSEVTEAKDRVIERVRTVNPKYFELIDLSFLGGKNGQSADFEELTAELLTDELIFQGQHLGGSNKPDVAVYYKTDGLIIDTKAYEKGFAISGHQRDEMSRYINDNQKRDTYINPNEWWKVYPDSVNHFNHLFVSSFFTGQFSQQLGYIARDKGENGAGITAENLLYLADELKTGKRKYEDIKFLMRNDEIII